jgi:hypothetical protein
MLCDAIIKAVSKLIPQVAVSTIYDDLFLNLHIGLIFSTLLNSFITFKVLKAYFSFTNYIRHCAF